MTPDQTPYVLLVDDETAFLETLSKRLAKRGLRTAAAADGPTALALLDRDPEVDVVILDVKLPGLDGIEVLRQIKAGHPLTEVIMLTGHATMESAVDGMRLGAYDFLLKPCEMDDLLAKVFEAFARRRRHLRRIEEALAVGRGMTA